VSSLLALNYSRPTFTQITTFTLPNSMYSLLTQIEIPICILLDSPLECHTEDSHNNLDFSLSMVIVTAKESIATAQKVLAHVPPFPTDIDNSPFCPQHATCKQIWIEKWFLGLG